MRNLIPIVMAAFLTGPTPSALAQSGGNDPLEDLSTRFMEGYETRDTLQMFDQILATLDPVDPQTSIFFPSAQIRPLTMAVLALEAVEGARDRVRYRITYGIEHLPGLTNGRRFPASFIQVDRFSLGGAIRQDIIDSYGGEHVGPPEAFDAGPHVSWRLITRPVQGTRADIMAVGRTEISDIDAQGMTCLNNPCLSPVMELESAAPWGEVEDAPLNSDPVPFKVERAGLLTPAAALDQLMLDSSFAEAGQSRDVPGVPDPFLEAVIEVNLAQDSVLDTGMRRGKLMDDSVATIWRRLIIMPMGETAQTPAAYRAETYECRRGPQFPSPGGLCP